jgi:hypothetical protein
MSKGREEQGKGRKGQGQRKARARAAKSKGKEEQGQGGATTMGSDRGKLRTCRAIFKVKRLEGEVKGIERGGPRNPFLSFLEHHIHMVPSVMVKRFYSHQPTS